MSHFGYILAAFHVVHFHNNNNRLHVEVVTVYRNLHGRGDSRDCVSLIMDEMCRVHYRRYMVTAEIMETNYTPTGNS